MDRIENTPVARIEEIRRRQKEYFDSGATRSTKFRRQQLERFRDALVKWEKPLCDALWTDLHKSYEEAYLTELSIVLGEIKTCIRNLSLWTRPSRRSTPLKMFPSASKVLPEPLGNALIISPWNYPVQLLLNPLAGAIAAGCTAVLKPSPYVPNVSKVIEEMVSATFGEGHVAVVQGNRETNKVLLNERWDMIFFTGSPALGRTVMEAAARNLTPVILELGGKSPCIVDKDADIKVAARRIAWGKSLNAGQTCIAPDYLMVHESIRENFLAELDRQFRSLLGEDPEKSGHFVRIVSDKAFDRIESYISQGKVLYGGNRKRNGRYIEPTIMEPAGTDVPVMQEEIFGPVFPVITFKDIDEAADFVNSREKPLALYYFGGSGDRILQRTSSGGACINDTIMHIANGNLPFGGVGMSGMGSYHGKLSFDAFTHYRAVVKTGTWIDLPFRYMPYKMFRLVKRIL